MNNAHGLTSMHGGHNDSIGCEVTECKYHDKAENYCTLQQIMVVKHEANASTEQCTDCGSFERE